MKAKFPVLMKNAVTYGVILGGILIVVSLLLYILNVNIFSIIFSVLNFLVFVLALPITFCIIGTNVLRQKHQEERVISYLDSAVHCFILLLVAMLLSNVYSYIFFHFIDKEYLQHMIDKFVEMMNSYNVPQEKIDESVAKMQKGFEIGRQLLSTLIISVVLALVISIFIRKKDKIKETF
jgi:hypothetical protein